MGKGFRTSLGHQQTKKPAVQRASSKLGVKKQKGGYQGAWYWSLPKGLKEIKGVEPARI